MASDEQADQSDSSLVGAGVVAGALVRAADARVIVISASLALIVGVGITLLAVAIGSTVGLSADFRSLVPLAPPDKRAALLTSIYIVTYLAFGVPAIVTLPMVLQIRETMVLQSVELEEKAS